MKVLKPSSIPYNPNASYPNDWIGWGDFLGSDITREYKTFNEFVEYVRSLGIKSKREWQEYWDEHKGCGFPSNAQQTYQQNGWTSWPEVTNCFAYAKGRYLDFDTARPQCRVLNLSSRTAYKKWRKSQNSSCLLPVDPESVYKKSGWNGWKDFLGQPDIALIDIEEAKRIVHPLKFRSMKEFQRARKNGQVPLSVPANPEIVYKPKGTWTGSGDFLGNGNVTFIDRQWISLEDLQCLIQSTGCNTREQYKTWQSSNKRTKNGLWIPDAPNALYKKKGWKGWGTLLGTKHLRGSSFLPYLEAKMLVQSLGITNRTDWRDKYKTGLLPTGLPASPESKYGDEFEGWDVWLGKQLC